MVVFTGWLFISHLYFHSSVSLFASQIPGTQFLNYIHYSCMNLTFFFKISVMFVLKESSKKEREKDTLVLSVRSFAKASCKENSHNIIISSIC